MHSSKKEHPLRWFGKTPVSLDATFIHFIIKITFGVSTKFKRGRTV